MILKNQAIKEKIIEQFTQQVGYTPNIDNPKSFNEKIQWLKLYYRNPLLTKCADKYTVRDYVKEKIGEQYLIPLIGVYDNPDQVDFNKLPNKFVLKTNNGSGKNIICKNKKKLNIEETKSKLTEWLKPENSHYFYSYEWSYKNIKPKIICEEYIEENNHKLKDYRVICFNGKAKFIWVDTDSVNNDSNHRRNIFDLKWKEINIEIGHPQNRLGSIKKPKKLSTLIKLAETLASGLPHVRVDFYYTKKKIYFGEMTFYTQNGMAYFKPPEWDYKLGELLELPIKIKPSLDNIQNLKNELISKEIKYGGIVTNIPRNKVSPKDPRTKEQLATGGMTGGDRMFHHGYAQYYAKYLLPYLKKKNLNITEVGILKGTGLATWADIFSKPNIIGLDIDINYFKNNLSHLLKLGAFKKNIPKVFEFDQFIDNSTLLNKLFCLKKIDICIDDGQHSNKANLNTFKQILPFLSSNFVYFIEDNSNVHKIIKDKYPQFKVESFGELTVITNPMHEIIDYLKYKKTRKAKVAIYTAYNKNYDKLLNHTHISKNFDYICFTDKNIKNPGIWEIKPINNLKLDAVRTSRYYKLFPHKLLPKYKYSVWIDTNVDITSNTLENRINQLIKKNIKIAIPPHFERNCIYQEAKACIDFQKDNPEIILKQINYLKKQKYPKNNGLFENNLIFREHNDSKIIKVMDDWWWMINNFSRRDQLSLNYVLWKNNINCTPLFPKNARLMNDDFIFKDHNTKIVSTIYIDTGTGFNNDNFIQKLVTVIGNKYKASFDLSEYKNIKQINFNPLKNQFCQFEINRIMIDKKTISLSKINYQTNGNSLDNGLIDFSKTSDPQIIININKKINKLKIIGNINFYNLENLYIDSTNQINNLIQEKEQIKLDSTNQINNLKKQLQNINRLIEKKNKITDNINTEEQKIQEILQQLNEIKSSKAFKLWRLYCKIIGK